MSPGRAPRLRGDGPRHPPAHVPFHRAPRLRGDGPRGGRPRDGERCSPPARGWPRGRRRGDGGRSRAPRLRGDGPGTTTHTITFSTCSPPARGWPSAQCEHRRRVGCSPPAPGWPRHDHCPSGARVCSPPARGWPLRPAQGPGRLDVLPACAGMAPARSRAASCRLSAPRLRGDGPSSSSAPTLSRQCSPPARGWPRQRPAGRRIARVLPACAGMARHRGPRRRRAGWCSPPARGWPVLKQTPWSATGCSPPARGWPLVHRRPGDPQAVLPACAGMAPSSPRATSALRSAPRLRGDGPLRTIPHERRIAGCSPPARGWPPAADAVLADVPVPPPARGWPPRVAVSDTLLPVLPACAGMAPRQRPHVQQDAGAPRLRGDGPDPERFRSLIAGCSPPARGWPHLHRGAGAGCRRAPRLRGDGPGTGGGISSSRECSPPARGWPLLRQGRHLPAQRAPRLRGDGPAAG